MTRWRVITGHVMAVLLGIALAWRPWRTVPSTTMDGVIHGPLERGGESDRHDARPGPGGSSTRARSEAYAEAWKLLVVRNLPNEERWPLEQRLLDEWADVDLEAALGTALDCNPLEGGFLISPFLRRMSADPERFRPWIRDGRYGSHATELLDVWTRWGGADATSPGH